MIIQPVCFVSPARRAHAGQRRTGYTAVSPAAPAQAAPRAAIFAGVALRLRRDEKTSGHSVPSIDKPLAERRGAKQFG